MADATYSVEYAKSGRATCKGTKEKIPKDALRIAKITKMDRNGEEIMMSAWYLPVPFFQMMKRMRKNSKFVESSSDLAGFDDLKDEDKAALEKMIADYYDDDVDFPPKPPKKEKKRKEESEDGEAAAAAAPSPKKAKPAAPGAEFAAEVRTDVTQPMLRDIADELSERLRAAGYNVPEAAAARQQLGPICIQSLSGTDLDVAAVLKAGAEQWKKKAEVECENEGNAALAGAFLELSSFEFKKGNSMKGVAYKKVSKALSEHATAITSGKEATKLANIGKSSGEKIDQFLETGTIAKLEEYKNEV
mmetsp:Transcript_18609/g.58149  ORF Transcript_18609/g.58149 Transcript_18609/m.58149 type:complete len:304 (+) Transcript_18609:102-1013(+)